MDKIFNKPFAVNGARVAIPENGTENERVSFDKGFTQPYEVEAPSVDNPAGQGFNILRPEMNEALYQLSSACNFLAENIDKWTALTTENLNNITELGRYFQATQSQATNANNYPTNETGYLIVINSVNGNVTQFYKVANSNVFYTRYKQGDIWGGWDILALSSEVMAKITELKNELNSPTHRYGTIKCNPSENTILWQTGGFSIAKQNAYTTRITHNIGTENYSVSAIINRASVGGVCTANIVSITNNYCDISFHWATHNTTGSFLPTIANITFFY